MSTPWRNRPGSVALPHMGWHLTFFMSTEDIISKMRSNSHARQHGLFQGLPKNWIHQQTGWEPLLWQKISTCTPVNERACWAAECNATDRKSIPWSQLPSLRTWPRHPHVSNVEAALAFEVYAAVNSERASQLPTGSPAIPIK